MVSSKSEERWPKLKHRILELLIMSSALECTLEDALSLCLNQCAYLLKMDVKQQNSPTNCKIFKRTRVIKAQVVSCL